MLAFENTTAVARYMKYLQDQDDLAAVERQHEGFTSMRVWLEQKQEEAEAFHETADLSDSTQHSREEYVHSSDFPASDEFLCMLSVEGKVQSTSGSGEELETQIYWVAGFGVLVSGDVNTTHEVSNSTLSTSCRTET